MDHLGCKIDRDLPNLTLGLPRPDRCQSGTRFRQIRQFVIVAAIDEDLMPVGAQQCHLGIDNAVFATAVVITIMDD